MLVLVSFELAPQKDWARQIEVRHAFQDLNVNNGIISIVHVLTFSSNNNTDIVVYRLLYIAPFIQVAPLEFAPS